MGGLVRFYQATSGCGRARFYAAPFGHGPRVAAETMAGLLNVRLGEWEESADPRRDTNGTHRVVLNFGAVDACAADDRRAYRVWIDCLMWLRHALPAPVLEYDLILAESFFDLRRAFRGLPQLIQIPPLLGPLPPPSPAGADRDFILVSFGGVETPYTQDIHRVLIPAAVLRSLSRAVRERDGDGRRILCCVPPRLGHPLTGLPELDGVRCASPTRKDFLRLLRRASLYVVQPGLYGPFESFGLGVPTVFCPPFSYTQVCQARKYDAHDLLGAVPLWPDLDQEVGPLDGDIEAEEPLCFKLLARWLREQDGSPNLRVHFRRWAEAAVGGAAGLDELTRKRAKYVSARGALTDDYLAVVARRLS